LARPRYIANSLPRHRSPVDRRPRRATSNWIEPDLLLMETLATARPGGTRSRGSARGYRTHYGRIGANFLTNCGPHSGIHCPRPFARRSPRCKSAESAPSTSLRPGPRAPTRMTRGRGGSLHLPRRVLSRPTSCRSPGVRVHPSRPVEPPQPMSDHLLLSKEARRLTVASNSAAKVRRSFWQQGWTSSRSHAQAKTLNAESAAIDLRRRFHFVHVGSIIFLHEARRQIN